MRARNGKKILSALLAAAILLSMAACGKKDEAEAGADGEEGAAAPELIEEYPFGELSVPGLTSESSGAAVETVMTYTYTGLSSPGGDVKSYVSLMKSDANGFEVVDKDYVISDQPEYDDAGSVLLAKAAPEAGEDGDSAAGALMLIDISWAEDSCVIVTRQAEGEISQPPEPVTMREAQQYLESLSPADLGLEGESMDEYEVFTFDGTVIVDGRACVRMNVYRFNESTEFMGCYLMSLDARHLYRMDTATQEITEID